MTLFKSTLSISLITLVSRVSGLIREMLFAAYFGASSQTDAFFVAFRIPNLLRRLFAEGALSQAFIPVLAEVKIKKGESECQLLSLKILIVLLCLLSSIVVLGIIFADYIVFAMSAGFQGDETTNYLSVNLTRLMFPYILFISLSALISGIQNTFSEFKLPAFIPVILNVAFIASIVILAPLLEEPIYCLAFAVITGGIAQLTLQIWGLKRIGFFKNVRQNISLLLNSKFLDENVRKIVRIFVPATFAVSIAQISIIINTNIASRLETGSVSWLSYADRIMEFPTALLGVALGTVLLPNLADAWSAGKSQRISDLIDWGLKLTFFLSLPISIIVHNLALPLASVIFHYGAFSDYDLDKSAMAISAYSVGIIGLISVKILAPGFYARQEIKIPVVVGILTLIITQVLNFILVPIYQHAGLAYAISIAACFNAILLLSILVRKKIYRPNKSWFMFVAKIIIGCIVVYLVSAYMAGVLDWKAMKTQPLERIFYFAVMLVTCLVAYLSVTRIIGINFKNLIKQ